MRLTERAKRKLKSLGIKEFAIVEEVDSCCSISYSIYAGKKLDDFVEVNGFRVYFDPKLRDKLARCEIDFDGFFTIKFD